MGGERLQVFETNAKSGQAPYRFTSAVRQSMSGTVTDFSGISHTRPVVAAGSEANPSSSTNVTGPSVSPPAVGTLLLFIGATGSAPALDGAGGDDADD